MRFFVTDKVTLDKTQQRAAVYLQVAARNLEARYNDKLSDYKSCRKFWRKLRLRVGDFGKYGISASVRNNLIDRNRGDISEYSEQGIYIYGSVGTGKTMLMKAFVDYIDIPKSIVHFQKFMQEIHQQIHHLQSESREKLISDLAKTIADKYRLLAIDEFEIRDISDAMLIMRLFDELSKRGVFLCVTSNIEPNELYKDGIQRSLFLPCINQINEHFGVLYLDGTLDYRLKKNKKLTCENKEQGDSSVSNAPLEMQGLYTADTSNRILYPINTKNESLLKDIKDSIMTSSPEREPVARSIMVFGRDVSFKNAYKTSLFTDFIELICRDLSYIDYVNICQEFKVIILENIKKIQEDETDKIIRFINFIDNAYFYKVLLFVSLECPVQDIYTKGSRVVEFRRSISRLAEMNSQEYFEIAMQSIQSVKIQSDAGSDH